MFPAAGLHSYLTHGGFKIKYQDRNNLVYSETRIHVEMGLDFRYYAHVSKEQITIGPHFMRFLQSIIAWKIA